MSFYDRYLEVLRQHYPETANSPNLRERLSANLVSPHVLRLPRTIQTQAQNIVAAFFNLRMKPEYQDATFAQFPEWRSGAQNFSALMSYDFHINDQGQLKLIEINTNASSSLLTDLLYEAQGVSHPFSTGFRNEIMTTFENEFRLSGAQGPLTSIAIVDEKPSTQRLFIEFLLYQELFKTRGYHAEILDPTEANLSKINLIYNRHTDFFLQKPEVQNIRQAYFSQKLCLTPNPREYLLLADKNRILELSQSNALARFNLSHNDRSALEAALIPAHSVSQHPHPEEFWQRRKNLFFKPTQSFGGKATYKGASVTKSAFKTILQGNYLAQEYVPASKVVLGDLEFKVDLRFYAYQNKIQLLAARLYQGQMTNVNTPGGGLTAIEFI